MKLRNIISTAAIALLPVVGSAATLVVPAAGSGPGANNSQWQSELTIHNAAPRAATVTVSFVQGKVVLGSAGLTLQAKQTLSRADIARTLGATSGSGALVIEVADRDARAIAVTSRTFNTSSEGEFGQDIPAVDVANAARPGDLVVLNGPPVAQNNRFNFGLYTVDATDVTWELVRADGTVAATKDVSYFGGGQALYGSGIETLLGVTPAANDAVRARVNTGKAIFFGSIVNATGDPTFVPGVRTRDDIIINFTGVDLDENGTVDIADQNGDGILDAPVNVITSMFPAYFRVVAEGEFGETVSYEIVSAPTTTQLLDAAGTIRVVAAGDKKNTVGDIVVKVTVGNASTLVTIPLKFR
ncbi:MAG TPA: hypothetical protein VFP80_15190 [Thermoanaerobaculia bacterium]|nr:hypothetical protein [Thermoanaerobaculia bacterium]